MATVKVGLSPLGVAVNPDAKTVYVINSGDNSVSMIDAGSNAVKTSIKVGNQPNGMRSIRRPSVLSSPTPWTTPCRSSTSEPTPVIGAAIKVGKD